MSVDSLDAHRESSKDILAVTGAATNFPMIADHDRRIAMLDGTLDPQAGDTATVRSVFVIGPDKRIERTLAYPASTGRNFDELMRTIDSLQLTAGHQVATPVNWRPGDVVIIVPGSQTPPPASATPKAGARPRRISATYRRPIWRTATPRRPRRPARSRSTGRRVREASLIAITSRRKMRRDGTASAGAGRKRLRSWRERDRPLCWSV